MSEKEYKLKLEAINEEFENKKKLLAKEFALSNNPYKVGDVFTDHMGSIKIEKISWRFNYEALPCCVYEGLELKKDGSPTKRVGRRSAHQSNGMRFKPL